MATIRYEKWEVLASNLGFAIMFQYSKLGLYQFTIKNCGNDSGVVLVFKAQRFCTFLELTEGKYPKMDASYQSLELPGLYFAGAAAHGRDYRRSAGGFIHGFRWGYQPMMLT